MSSVQRLPKATQIHGEFYPKPQQPTLLEVAPYFATAYRKLPNPRQLTICAKGLRRPRTHAKASPQLPTSPINVCSISRCSEEHWCRTPLQVDW